MDTAMVERRSGGVCELCEGTDDPSVVAVPPRDEGLMMCATCRRHVDDDEVNHWRCLSGAAWSEVAAVQVMAWRLLHRLDATWAVDLRDQMYLDDDTEAWARALVDRPPTLDSNGVALVDGDSVTLIKDLVVKGANFTAKRGTLVKNIRTGDDPLLVEGRVEKTSIYLVAAFLKKA